MAEAVITIGKDELSCACESAHILVDMQRSIALHRMTVPDFEAKVRAAYAEAYAKASESNRGMVDKVVGGGDSPSPDQALAQVLQRLWCIDMPGFIPAVRAICERK